MEDCRTVEPQTGRAVRWLVQGGAVQHVQVNLLTAELVRLGEEAARLSGGTVSVERFVVASFTRVNPVGGCGHARRQPQRRRGDPGRRGRGDRKLDPSGRGAPPGVQHC
jgi:hypothetical protein